MNKVVPLLIAGMLAWPALAADLTRLQLKVTNLDGKPVDRASVVINFVKGRSAVKLGKKMMTHWEVRTNQEGLVKIPQIPQGEILVQVIANLLSNAIKFVRPGEAARIEVSSETIKDSVRLSIRDNGIGIDKQYQQRIFIIFQRLHNRSVYEGSGIGLAHCKKIVELHGGNIWVDSEAGKGSTFYFTLVDL